MGQGASSCTDSKSADGCVPPARNPRQNRNNTHQRRDVLTEKIIKAIKYDDIERLRRLLDKDLTDNIDQVAVVEEPDCCVPPSNRIAIPPPNGPIDVFSLRFDKDFTCLHIAASWGAGDVVRYLIESQGMDVNQQSTITGATAVHLAALDNHIDIVIYFISVLAKLNIKDFEGRMAIDYCQTQEMKDLINRNMRHEGAVNELSTDLDYGFFKWNKEERFDTENPLRSSGRMKKSEKGKTTNGIPPPPPSSSFFYMAPSYADELDNTNSTQADVRKQSMDQETTTIPSDTAMMNDDIISETKTNDDVNDDIQSTPPPPPPPPRPISLPVPRMVVHDHGDGEEKNDENESIPSPTSVALMTSAEKGNTVINSPLYQSYRKSDILEKLSSKNRSGRATSIRLKTAIPELETSLSPPPPPPPPPPPQRSIE